VTCLGPLRIGFLGNQNNYPFVLARALRRAGHEVRVVVDQLERLDRPEHRYADIAYPYPDWIRECAPLDLEDVVYGTPVWQRTLDAVRDCDALVLNRWSYAAAAALDLPAFCLTTGADVEFWSWPDGAEAHACHVERLSRERTWPRDAFRQGPIDSAWLRRMLNHSPTPLYRAWRKHVFRRFARLQRGGLRRAVGVSAFPDAVSSRLADVMRECLRPGARRTCLLMSEASAIAPTPQPRNEVLRVFNAARLLWKMPFPGSVGAWENKGTDVLLRGIAQWHLRTGRPLDLRLVEKGPSVAATKRLVSDLGIGHLVTWQPELTQKQVFDEYARADVVSEQCGLHVLGMAGYEAMAAGRPVLANGRPELFEPIFGAPPPVAQARTPDEVASQIERLHDPAERERLGGVGRAFVERHLSPDAAAREVAGILAEAVASRDRAKRQHAA
jgi:glycosyltransferase involved in cell wall biosynthesis